MHTYPSTHTVLQGRPHLILLDHGLYKRISPEFRREYAGLWRSLILADEQGIKEHSQKMNAAEMYPLFASMLTARPWDQIVKRRDDVGKNLRAPGTEDDKKLIQVRRRTLFSSLSL